MTTGPDLRPLGWVQTIDVAIRLASRNWKPLMIVQLVVWLPFAVLETFVPFFLADEVTMIDGQVQYFYFTQNDLDTANLIGGLLGLLGTLATAVAILVMVRICADAYSGAESLEPRQAIAYGVRRLGSLLWIGIVIVAAFIGVVVVAALLLAVIQAFAFLLVVPLISFLFVRWFVVVPALVVEDARGVGALRRSWRLVANRWWPTFGAFALAAVVVIAVQIGLAALLLPLLELDNATLFVVVLFVSTTIVSLVLNPFLASVPTVVYFDLRVRREGLDLEIMQRSLDTDASTGAPPPPSGFGLPPPPSAPPPPPSGAAPVAPPPPPRAGDVASPPGETEEAAPGPGTVPPPLDLSTSGASAPEPASRASSVDAYVDCPDCGRAVHRSASSCPYCGGSLGGAPPGGDEPTHA